MTHRVPKGDQPARLRNNPGSVALTLALLLAASQSMAAGREAAPPPRTRHFPESGITFDSDFEGARLNGCTQRGPAEFDALICAEDEPINNSAWYAFRVSAKTAQRVTVHLRYQGGSHRYQPWTSSDGLHWERLPAGAYRTAEKSATLSIDAGPKPVWISAQEQIGLRELEAWIDRLAERPGIEASHVGRSVEGRAIRKLTIGAETPRYGVFIIGRQHPPEVTGSLALMAFVETIAGPGELAEEFRRACQTTVVPLVNPDGVAAGNWRHNMHGYDLNRDWGPFRQPETSAVRDEILKHQGPDKPRLVFFLDFHSTHNDVFYIEGGKEPVWPADFADRWLDAVSERLPDYKLRRETAAGSRPLSKMWVRKTLRIPAVIYEVGDNTDRAQIRRVAQAAAEEMMRLALEEIERESPPPAPRELRKVPAAATSQTLFQLLGAS